MGMYISPILELDICQRHHFFLLFVGIPTCFHSVGDKLEAHYFRNILIDNFKFTALVEFITGTFTFPFAVELMFADRHAA